MADDDNIIQFKPIAATSWSSRHAFNASSSTTGPDVARLGSTVLARLDAGASMLLIEVKRKARVKS